MFWLGGKQRWSCALEPVSSGLLANLKLTLRFRAGNSQVTHCPLSSSFCESIHTSRLAETNHCSKTPDACACMQVVRLAWAQDPAVLDDGTLVDAMNAAP